jgi:molybdate transport system permease protein
MDWMAITISLKLAFVTGLLLLPVGFALAYWLAFSESKIKRPIEILTMLPLILPPTVLGLYLLMAFSPPIGGTAEGGAWWQSLAQIVGLQGLAFRFEGLVLASLIANLPFMVQPIVRSLASIPQSLRETAWTCGLSRWQTLWKVELPLAWPGVVTGLALTAAHTLGEFGVVLMVGGNLPGETRTLSIAIYDRVQAFDMAGANQMAAVLLGISVTTLAGILVLSRKQNWLGQRNA